MAIDEGRAWALQTLGADGVLVRERIPTIIRDCHEKMANAQVESDMRHTGVYGQIWRKCLDEFVAELGQLPSAEIIPRRGYKLVSFNGAVLFPWRFAKERSTDVGSRPFAVSETRLSLFTQERDIAQYCLDIEYDHPELTEEEQKLLLDTEAKALEETLSSHSVVVVAYASNPSALHSIDWGEATLGTDGYLAFVTIESLLDIGSGSLVDVELTEEEGFADGPIPHPQLGVKEEDGGAHG
ncbi:hypothetical protein [Corynebacterium terpenotabidum]|uniref:Uncharacterized protein n=1 Tax=Corynebacterium terpenotabidum Y-11 TaxID=1200352 RepID=S4XMB4_9CORY|nr:hypothetical protein [Corynebacterium terpenotabidum]AGP31773.1 hypothetical protein A606_10670 [Corynebacterium terpenotabidum Y-11]